MKFNKSLVIIMLIIALLLVAGCSESKRTIPRSDSSASTAKTATMSCTQRWSCDGDTKFFINGDCSRSNQEYCPDGCDDGACITFVEPEEKEELTVKTSNMPADTDDDDLLETGMYKMEEGEENLIDVDGEQLYVKVLVIEPVDESVKFKINRDRSFGLQKGNMIILKDEYDEDDEIVIEIVDIILEDPIRDVPAKVIFKFAKIDR